VKVVKNDADKELPLTQKILLATTIQPKIDEQLKRLRALEGLGDASFPFDFLSGYKVLLAETKDQDPDSVKLSGVAEYLTKVVDNIEKKLWKDSMIREAVLEKWTAPHNIILLVSADLKAQTGVVAKTAYNGLKIEGGDLYVMAAAGKWWTNINEVGSLDLTKAL